MEYSLSYRLGAFKGGTFDPDAAAYIAAVEEEDAQALEPDVKKAYNNFIVGCKSDGIWDAIKASCILAGARTLDGALVPFKGAAPTNFNFVSGDYNRKTGLIGDGVTKYLNSNRAGNAENQDNCSYWVFATTSATNFMGNTENQPTAGQILLNGASNNYRIKSGTTTVGPVPSNGTFCGMSRGVASSFNLRVNGSTTNYAVASDGNLSANIRIFSRVNVAYSSGRISVYGIGESIDLALLDARVSTLMTELSVAIP